MTLAAFLEEVILDSLKDFGKLLPFLFLTYLLMEFLEHRAGEGMEKAIRRAGHVGPLWGGLLGVVPQCGFSAAASGLYAGRVISLGTLIALYLSTSDEMLPILIAEGAAPLLIVKLLLVKFVIGTLAGFLIDLSFRLLKSKEREHEHIHELCEHEGCHCEEGIFRSALHHTLHIGLFLLIVMLLLNTAVFFLGHERIADIFSTVPVLGHILAALVGLIPNCASSVLITKLYLEGMISAGCMLSGLLVGTGVGLLVLFRVSRRKRDAFSVLLMLFGIGALAGMLIDLLGIGNIL
ncbi:MAG: hypothetical protein E7609_01645 [Ruminococcaceae bacterium]|nr:hypothetical protein [Oscillospiraceae bacterium]